jgi:hypothetical protein
LEQIEALDLDHNKVANFSSWDTVSTKCLNMCLRLKLIEETVVIAKITESIRRIGRLSYNQHIMRSIAPDHTLSPQSLAFAIQHGEFTDEELGEIKFDHGETPNSFMIRAVHIFPMLVLQQLKGFKGLEDRTDVKVDDCC